MGTADFYSEPFLRHLLTNSHSFPHSEDGAQTTNGLTLAFGFPKNKAPIVGRQAQIESKKASHHLLSTCMGNNINESLIVNGHFLLPTPEALQSGFGVIFFYLARRLLGKSPANFSVNFHSEMFSASLLWGFRPPPKIDGIPLQFHIFEPKSVSRRFLHTGEINISCFSNRALVKAIKFEASRCL